MLRRFSRTIPCILASLTILLLALVPATVLADTNDFVITSFASDQTLTRDDPQGTLKIREDITVEYSDNNHGLLRAIPKEYKGQSLALRITSISSKTGAPTEYTTYSSNGNTVLKIGSPDKTVTGKQQYTIQYTVQNVIAFYDDYDELYWDINGDTWTQPFLAVNATIHLPNGVTLRRTVCYSGFYGGTDKNCSIAVSNNDINVASVGVLGADQTLSYVAAFDSGYFSAPTVMDWWRDNWMHVVAVLGIPLLVGIFVTRYWWRNGKDIKGRGVIVPEYGPPKDISPAEAGIIYDYKFESKDISATIIDLAIRAYIRLIEKDKKGFLQSGKEYSLECVNQNWKSLKPHEISILQGIFSENPTVGTVVTLSSLQNSFYKTTAHVQKILYKELTGNYFAKNPLSVGLRLYISAGILGILAILIHTWASIGLLIAAVITVIFASLMPRRTTIGVATLEHLKGLRLYLKTAESERIAMLQSPNAPYASVLPEPERTIVLFERLLPFAIILGVEREWAKQFKNIYTAPPDWFSGNWTTFSTIALVSNLGISMTAMNTSFAAPSSSSGSGFGGGGFSGGGGGGGGGGGW